MNAATLPKIESKTADASMALLGKLTAAYRANAELRNLLASMYFYRYNTDRGARRIDLGWTIETANDIADKGTRALIEAAGLIGHDEGDLAHFLSPEQIGAFQTA